MARRVDAEARRADIANKAMKLFADVGYDNVTLIMIAYEAKVARTVLYRHFKNKREVLDAAILANTRMIMAECRRIADRPESARRRLEAICLRVADILFERKDYLTAIFDFVLAMVREGEEMGGKIMEFTFRLRETVKALVGEGRANGEFAAWIDPEATAEGLFAQLELTVMRIVLRTETDPQSAGRRLREAIRAISRP